MIVSSIPHIHNPPKHSHGFSSLRSGRQMLVSRNTSVWMFSSTLLTPAGRSRKPSTSQ
jgi:hypothetical protein